MTSPWLLMVLCLVAYCGAFGLGYFAGVKKNRRVNGILRHRESGGMIGISDDGLTLMDFHVEEK